MSDIDLSQALGAFVAYIAPRSTFDAWCAARVTYARFLNHPFGRDVPRRGDCSDEVCLIAPPGETVSSVDAMMLVLANELRGATKQNTSFKLRIHRIDVGDFFGVEKHGSRMYDLYFEVVSKWGTFICAGCNNYTGAGGEGGRTLEGLFRLIADAFGNEVEESVTFGRGGVKIREFFHEVHTAEWRRSAAM